ncbi:MAG: AI-2E family transporter, partial [Halocynthiibacter sp.]
MSLQKQLVFWLVALMMLIGILYLLGGILLPFVAGMALAYMLDPVADRLEGMGLSRTIATSVIIGIAILVFVAVVVLLVPIIGNQIGQLAAATPDAMRAIEAELASRLDWLRELTKNSDITVEGYLAGVAKDAVGWLAKLAGGLLSGGVALLNLISLLVVTPVVAFYLLVDWDNIVAKVDSWLPLDHRQSIRQIFHDIDRALAGFVRGQSTVSLILGSFYAIGLTVAGLK